MDDFPFGPGQVRPPLPGVICPDGPCVVDGEPTRLRRLLGTRFLILIQDGTGPDLPTGVPHKVHALRDIDTEQVLGEALRSGPETVHIVRPDGHLAAVLPSCDPGQVVKALHRACGRT